MTVWELHLKISSPGLRLQGEALFALTLLPEMKELCTINSLTVVIMTTANVPVI